MARKTKAEKELDLVSEAKKFFEEREKAENENRSGLAADLRFCYVPGEQWEETMRTKRQGKPCYTYNRTMKKVNQVVGDQRKAKASGKVRAVNKQASAEVADVFGGMIRNIEAQSSAETIYDEGFKYAVAGAWGAWRIVPDYCDDESFDQELKILRIPNPLTVYWDEGADPFGRGSMQCVVAERISVDAYKALYGDEAFTNVEVSRDSRGWLSADKEVRVAEYYKMIPTQVTKAELSDGRTVVWSQKLEDEIKAMTEAGLQAPTVERKRKVTEWVCRWAKIDGANVLEGPIDYDYKHIPVIRCPGRYINIEGKQYFQSLIRHAKDPQRTYNYHRSTMVEAVALVPRAPYIGTAKMFKGYEDQWQKANSSNRPYLEYDVDPDAPNAKPTREPPPDVPQALISLAAQDAEDIDQATGYVSPNDVPDSMPESGRARRLRMLGGDSDSYEFLDNYGKAIQFTWECLIDMIPVTYDTERVVRIIGIDGKESEEEINVNGLNLAKGRYDVTVTLGPAYATARMEALDTLLEAAESMPIVAEVAPDILVKNFDVQGADEIEKRIRRKLIEAGQIEPTEEEAAEMGPPPPPDPVQVALKRRLDAQASKDEASAAKTASEAAVAIQAAVADLQKTLAEVAQLRAETILTAKQINAPDAETQVRVNT